MAGQASPDVLVSAEELKAADMWALGAMAFIISSLQYPFSGRLGSTGLL